jgi:uncharacterized OsmC-like protein
VRYRLRVSPDADRAAIDRVMRVHEDACPVARSIRDAITITTEIDVTTD